MNIKRLLKNKLVLMGGFVVLSLGGLAGPLFLSRAPGLAQASTHIIVYKSPTCGCCSSWEEHLRKNGFDVESRPVADMAEVKREQHVTQALSSCHTAKVGDYIIEGHVPAASIKRLLSEHPKNIVGLAVPGMPVGSPGMEGPNPQKYQVVSFDSSGQASVYAEY